MDQIVVMVGTLLASVIGLGLFGCVLLTTIRSASRSSRSKRVQLPPVIEENQLFIPLILRAIIRGYDTPELCREDDLARHGQAPDEQYFH